MWERYCRGVQAIVFVIDAADTDILDEARSELQSLLQKPSLKEVPLLVLGNKNDIAGALSTGELIDRLNLKVNFSIPKVLIRTLQLLNSVYVSDFDDDGAFNMSNLSIFCPLIKFAVQLQLIYIIYQLLQ